MSEITRLLLRTHSSFFGPDILFDKYFYAPAVPGQKTNENLINDRRKQIGLLIKARRDVMDHELFTGVIPKFERASSHKVLGLRTGKTLQGEAEVGYAQRLANFLFFKYRYAARTMSITGPFNPYLAPGFPCVILDQPMNREKLGEATKTLVETGDLTEIRELTGTHYLGSIVGLVHALSQAGGQTQIQTQYSRTHNEAVEALGADIIPAEAKKKQAGSEWVSSYVAALSEPQIGDQGLYGHKIVGVGEVDPTKVKRKQLNLQPEERFKGEYPLLGTHIKRTGKKAKWKRKFTTLVQVGIEKRAREFGPEVVGIVGNSNTKVKFRLFNIVEEVPNIEEIVYEDLPLEDIVRPAWYSTIWFNRAIGGAVYDKFFGTTAITDPLTVTDIIGGTSAEDIELAAELAARSGADSEDDFRLDLDTVGDLEQNSSIENAVDFLAYIYSRTKEGGYDIDAFIQSYTWRPVASIVDMFGTPNLEYEENEDGTVTVVKGVEGFHSRAFGNFKNLFGLVGPEIGKIIGVDNVYDQAAARLDVRRERWLAALDYAVELSQRALLG
jgi:hypothetical protein